MSSFYSDASLIVIPSGYKASKVYCAKPTDGTGDLTFTRSNDTATRVGPDGLIEKVRTNLVLHSQNFSNAAWSKSAGTTLTHSQTDPDGGTTATRVVMTSGTNNFFTQAISGSGTRFITLSVFVKGVTTGGTFSLNTGTAASRTGTTITYTTTWTRYQIIQNETTSNTGFQIDNFSDSVGQVAGDFLIAFAQVESSDFGATPYIPTTTAAVSVGPVANVPRLDYLGGGCPKLILEPQRVNSFFFSEQMNNAYYTKATCVVTANSTLTLDPSGNNGSDLVVTDNAASSGVIQRNETITAAQPQTLSIFLKYNGVEQVAFNVRDNVVAGNNAGATFNLITGVISVAAAAAGTCSNASATITDYGNDWYRCTLTFTNSATTAFRLRWFNAEVGNGVDGTFAWGFQWEQNSAYATSYIPTLGAAVTRGADACSKTGISSLIGQTEGTLFVEVDYSTLSGLNMFLSIRPNTSNKVEIYRDSGNIFGEITGSVNFAFSAAKPVGTHKIAFAYKSGSSALFIDGVLVNQNTTAFTFSATLADLFINQRSGGTFIEAANYKQALLFKTRLTNAQLASLTS